MRDEAAVRQASARRWIGRGFRSDDAPWRKPLSVSQSIRYWRVLVLGAHPMPSSTWIDHLRRDKSCGDGVNLISRWSTAPTIATVPRGPVRSTSCNKLACHFEVRKAPSFGRRSRRRRPGASHALVARSDRRIPSRNRRSRRCERDGSLDTRDSARVHSLIRDWRRTLARPR
jgi:hypothetical protein